MPNGITIEHLDGKLDRDGNRIENPPVGISGPIDHSDDDRSGFDRSGFDNSCIDWSGWGDYYNRGRGRTRD